MKIKIDGNEYDFPSLDSLTMDESIVIERTAGITIDQLTEPEASFSAGSLKALIVIAIRRVRPNVSEREIAEVVGKLNLFKLLDEFNQQREELEVEENPPAEASTGSGESTASTGDASSNGGDISPAPSPLSATGPRVSATGPGSVHQTSAA